MSFDPITYALAKKSGGSGGGAPSDWNAKEGEAGYVKNRTHYEGEDSVLLLTTEGVEKKTTMGWWWYPAPAGEYVAFEVGKTYSVGIDLQYHSEYYPGGYTINLEAGCVTANELRFSYYSPMSDGTVGSQETVFTITSRDDTADYKVYSSNFDDIIHVYGNVPTVHHLAPKYIKDMYYEEAEEVVLVEEQTVHGFRDKGGVYGVTAPFDFIPTTDETYTVRWDGTEYTCTLVLLDGLDVLNGMGIFGNNLFVGGQDTGEPFTIYFQTGIILVATFSSTEESHTIGITSQKNVVHHLAPKYIKDMYYENEVLTELLAETTLSFTEYTMNDYPELKGQYMNLSELGQNVYQGFVIGDEYIVTFDGVDYRVTANAESALVGYGNDVSNVYAHMPVYIKNISMGHTMVFTSTAGGHSIRIQHVTSEIKHLDEKYIPDLTSVVLKSSTEGSTKKFRVTVDDSGNLTATEV